MNSGNRIRRVLVCLVGVSLMCALNGGKSNVSTRSSGDELPPKRLKVTPSSLHDTGSTSQPVSPHVSRVRGVSARCGYMSDDERFGQEQSSDEDDDDVQSDNGYESNTSDDAPSGSESQDSACKSDSSCCRSQRYKGKQKRWSWGQINTFLRKHYACRINPNVLDSQ